MRRINLVAEVYERRNDPGAWGVEAIDAEADGIIQMAVFSGPDAQSRALEYADAKYRDFCLIS